MCAWSRCRIRGSSITHTMPLADAPRGYAIFDKKEDRAIKVMLKP